MTFPDKQKWKELINSKPAQPEILKRFHQAEIKGHQTVTLIHMNK